MIDQTMIMRCGSCGAEIDPDEYENCERCWVHDFAGDCCYRLQCELCAEEEGRVEHERDPTCDVCIAGAPGMRVFWHAKAVIDESAQRRRSDESGAVVPFSDMTAVRRIAIETARRIMNTQADAKDWLGWVIEAITVDGEHLMEVPFEVAMPAQGRCEVCAASLGKIAPTDELWTGATATIWSHAKDKEQACGDRTVCAACTARANEISAIAAAAEGLGPDSGCERCQARPEGPILRRIKYKLFSDDPWVASLERIKQQTEQSEKDSGSQKGPWVLR
ncbi:MAG: hypothetical protein J5I81_14440 [Nitrococcus mobilis]|nr:hypothetical protein [Nitrococcus mobilis]